METISIVRKTDNLGRIVLPAEMRRILNIGEKDGLEIFTEDDQIILRKYETACIFCGNDDDIINYNGKKICKECFSAVSRKTI
jgi:transcriptional pleiotropic regulator of transition state genes